MLHRRAVFAHGAFAVLDGLSDGKRGERQQENGGFHRLMLAETPCARQRHRACPSGEAVTRP
jgi:hypothetical protein